MWQFKSNWKPSVEKAYFKTGFKHAFIALLYLWKSTCPNLRHPTAPSKLIILTVLFVHTYFPTITESFMHLLVTEQINMDHETKHVGTNIFGMRRRKGLKCQDPISETLLWHMLQKLASGFLHHYIKKILWYFTQYCSLNALLSLKKANGKLKSIYKHHLLVALCTANRGNILIYLY